jgi:hypothetical protein
VRTAPADSMQALVAIGLSSPWEAGRLLEKSNQASPAYPTRQTLGSISRANNYSRLTLPNVGNSTHALGRGCASAMRARNRDSDRIGKIRERL